jgi:hypothetical protein
MTRAVYLLIGCCILSMLNKIENTNYIWALSFYLSTMCPKNIIVVSIINHSFGDCLSILASVRY